MDCKFFEKCDAPLCPLDEQSLENGIWYPDEAICGLRGRKDSWRKTQKKIAKAKGNGYFNLAMLSQQCRVSKEIRGLDPDLMEEPQLRKWMSIHPPLSEKQKEVALQNLARMRALKMEAQP